MPTLKKKLIPTTTTVSVGCGSSCRRINLSKIFNPKPKNKHKRSRFYQDSSSASTSLTTTPTATNATFSPTTSDTTAQVRSSRAVQGFGWNSLAVEKDSSDPFVDFRDSMLQMIMEKEIYGKDDLQELLNCFLQLNSPYYHAIIVRAFTEIWNNLSK
ncbi:hypothetical protein L1987_33600 [Smallanthus sonchifolius]|uniref:Uncharacterized protein n=1 Tax=Smallanthus sonchifolius TaxID=185202 RepID=A0ACB9HRB3_9ASTR|nr:hypothetical protein L1987_33600 [Smallanthus sonchifolius]